MKNYLDAEHYLNIYKVRLRMAKEGIANPTNEFKELMQTIVDKLSKLPLNEKITLDGNKMKDAKGNIIAEFPK